MTLALNNPQRLICYKTKKPNQINVNMQWMWFPNLYEWNNPTGIDIPLKLISNKICKSLESFSSIEFILMLVFVQCLYNKNAKDNFCSLINWSWQSAAPLCIQTLNNTSWNKYLIKDMSYIISFHFWIFQPFYIFFHSLCLLYTLV